MNDDIDVTAAAAYREGVDPIDWGIRLAEIQMFVPESVLTARATDADAFPGYHLDLTIEATARRIVGALLGAGWKPPECPS